MTLVCLLCRQPLADGQEITFTGRAYYHEIRSKVTYSLTTPHDADPRTFAHVTCSEEEEER